MQKKSLRQILIFFSLFILLVLPTAIVGISNFSALVNKAFGKPFVKDDSAFIVSTQSTEKIAKGGQFSLKVSTLAPKTLPLKYMVAFVEFDKNYVDVKSVQSQNPAQFKVAAFQNGYLVYPATMVQPTNLSDAIPEKCYDAKTCTFADNAYTTVTFSISAILLQELTEQQRPFKVTLIGAAESTSTIIWNQKVELPTLKLGQYVKNSSPTFTSTPENYIKSGKAFTYSVTTTDEDNDPVLLSLECPDKVFCTKSQNAPAGLTIEDNTIYWKNPVYRKDPYEITIYANDGKSVTTQTFNLHVLEEGTSYFSCQFSPAVAVKILDYRVETPLVIVANSTETLKAAKVTLSRIGSVEKTFNYAFNPSRKTIILDQNSTPSFKYQFNEGSYTGKAEFTSDSGEIFTCELENPTVSLGSLVKTATKQTIKQLLNSVYAATGINAGVNNTPVFLTDPMLPAASGGSSPSVSFVYGPTYSFTLRAQDVDGDPMQHTIVAKPSWATVSVNSTTPTTGASTYNIQITGIPQAKDAGSNLFSFSINDGYGHYITRTWVINIDYPNNDIPRVSLTAPTNFTLPSYCPPKTNTPVTLRQGQSFMMVFDAQDRNQIVKFSLYYTKSLSSTAKTTLLPNISYKMRCMSVSTANIAPGDYYFILTATDNFNPPATGSAYTGLVRILPPLPKPSVSVKPTTSVTATPTTSPTNTGTATPTPTPSVSTEPTPQPDEPLIQITSPKQNDNITPEDFQLVASLSASKDAELSKNNVVVKLDNTEITDKVLFSVDKGKAITISYKPSTLLDYAVHSITIQILDSRKKSTEQKISFTIINSDNANANSVTLFGFTVSKDLYTVFIVALILISILILLPIIMYFAFRNQDKDQSLTRRPVVPQPIPPHTPQLRTPTTAFATGASPSVPANPVQTQPFQPPTTSPFNRPPVVTSQPQPTYSQQVPASPVLTPIRPPLAAQQQPQMSSKQAIDSFINQVPVAQQPRPTSTQVPPVPNVSMPVTQPKVAAVTPQPSTLPSQPFQRPQGQSATSAPVPTVATPQPLPKQPVTQPASLPTITPQQQTTPKVTAAMPPTVPAKSPAPVPVMPQTNNMPSAPSVPQQVTSVTTQPAKPQVSPLLPQSNVASPATVAQTAKPLTQVPAATPAVTQATVQPVQPTPVAPAATAPTPTTVPASAPQQAAPQIAPQTVQQTTPNTAQKQVLPPESPSLPKKQ